MAALQAGDNGAFDTLYHRHYGGIKGFICNRVRGELRFDADDLVHEVFQQLHQARERFVRHQFVVAFLYRVAQCVTASYLRKALAQKRDYRRQLCRVNEKIPDIVNAEREAARKEADELLSRLTPAEAQIVRLMDLEGHTAKSAAEMLGIPMTTAQWRYRKAHQHLKEIAAELSVV